MSAMVASTEEVEVKLRFRSPDEALRRLRGLGATLAQAREFEDNVVFDRPSLELKGSDRLLRLRRKGDVSTVTFKQRLVERTRHKVCIEHESAVASPEGVEAVFAGLGYEPVYRYQKYRTTFELDGLEIALDETPIGCYVELEGDPAAIERVAADLGFVESQFIRDTYRDLHEAEAARSGTTAGDMVFPDATR